MIIASIAILPNNMNLSKQFLAAHFVKRNTKFGGGESEGGQKFLPPNPLPFCPPERQVSFLPRGARQSINSVQKMFERSCIIPPISNFPIFSRPIRRREAPQRTAGQGFRALRARPSAGSKSLAILGICFAQLLTNKNI